MAVLFRLTEHIRDLTLKRIEALVERDDRRLRRRGLVRKAGAVGRPALREDLALDLLNLALEPVETLLRRGGRLALRERRGSGQRDDGASRQDDDRTRKFH